MSGNVRRTRYSSKASVPTMKHVAERAGVSTATVSRVLTGFDGVSDELERRVREAVQELDYHPNRVARNLRVRTTRTIGVVISDIQNPFFTSLVRGIEDVLQTANYTFLLGNSDEDLVRERVYLSMLRAEGVAGIIFAPSTTNAEEYLPLIKAHAPLVAIDRGPTDIPIDLVCVDNRHGAAMAVTHLISLGHDRIGFIGGPASISTASERRAGYEQALAEAGLEAEPALLRSANFRQSGGYEAMLALLELRRRPSAVFVANNLMTLGALQALHEQGLQIPSDMAIVGFDDMPWATSLQPPLTAVSQPTYALGTTAATLLLERIKTPDRQPTHIALKTQLMVRASCGASNHETIGVDHVVDR
jgi:LacI family transcriptional regulator